MSVNDEKLHWVPFLKFQSEIKKEPYMVPVRSKMACIAIIGILYKTGNDKKQCKVI